MKTASGTAKITCILYFLCFILYPFQAQTTVDPAADSAKAGSVPAATAAVVPPPLRPRKPDPEKVSAAAEKDPDTDAVRKNGETLKYGIESEITDLIEKLTANEDPRFGDVLYDLFHTTKSPSVRQRILDYFAVLGDPCLEDFSVTVLNDPYDEPSGLVSSVFKYTSAVRCTAAVPAVIALLENGNETYFNDALSTLGDIGGEKEAVYLAAYLDRTDLTTSQRQMLVKVLGKIQASGTLEKLTKIAENSDENMFVRSYAAEAIGEIGKQESVPVLSRLFEDQDPNFRLYVIRGLKHYSSDLSGAVIIQGIRDSYYKVRLESIQAAGELHMTDSMPYLIYRAQNDPEGVVKEACYPVIAGLNTDDGNKFLVSVITGLKISDMAKSKAAAALMKYGYAGDREIAALAEDCLKSDLRKPLRYALGRQFALYGRPAYADICKQYLASKDALTVGTGLDIYASGKFQSIRATVQSIADDPRAGANQKKARFILGLDNK